MIEAEKTYFKATTIITVRINKGYPHFFKGDFNTNQY